MIFNLHKIVKKKLTDALLIRIESMDYFPVATFYKIYLECFIEMCKGFVVQRESHRLTEKLHPPTNKLLLEAEMLVLHLLTVALSMSQFVRSSSEVLGMLRVVKRERQALVIFVRYSWLNGPA